MESRTTPLVRSRSGLVSSLHDATFSGPKRQLVFYTSDDDILFDAATSGANSMAYGPAPQQPRTVRRRYSFPFRATDSKKLTRELQAASEAAVGCANNSATAAPPNSSKHNPGERKTRSADLGACTFPDEAKTTNGTASDADDSSWKAAGRKLRTTGIMSIRGSGLAIASASKMLQEKTQRVAQSQKTALRNFQLHGGLVRWLHGDDTSTEGAADDDGIGNGYASIVAQSERLEESQASTDSGAVAGLPLPPKAPSVASEAKGEQQGNGEQQQQQPLRRPSGGPADLEAARAAAAATAGFLRSSISRQRANSLLEGLYEKFKRAPSDTPDVVSPGRISLQPSPGRFSQRQPYSFANKIDTSLNIGFDDFVNSEGISSRDRERVLRESRHRSSSAGSSPTAIATRPRAATAPDGSSMGQMGHPSSDAFGLEDCLADPKLAAEFVSTTMPNDGAVLMLLYSIEEYQALVTSEPVPDGHVQATYASTIVDKFLSGSMQSLPRALVPAATIDELRQTIEQVRASSVTTSLPKNLFQDVYQATYAELGAAFDKFKQTREYALLQTRRQQERTVLSVDELLDDAWNCTVFWMFLYRTAHHHRLSFLMDKTFKLDVLHKDFVDNETPAAYSALVAALKLMARKFLAKSAPVSLSMTAASSIRLREEIAVEISYLSSQRTDHQTIERIMDKLNELYTDARTEFKSTCLERLTSFAASSLYRDFIDLVPATKQQATSPRSAPHDIVQLLRASRLPFHQAPVLPPCVDDLGALLRSCTTSATPDTANKSEVIQNVFMFIKTDLVTAQARVHPFEFVTLYEAPDVDPSRWSELHQTVEHFLVPEAAPRTFQITDSEAQQELCFNFVAGNGDNALYGAVWRTPLLRENLPPTVQGICVVSRHPVIDSLRSFLQVFARKRRLAVDVAATNTGGNTQFPAVIGDDVASTLDEAKAHLHVRLLDKHTTTTQEPSSSPESSDAISRSVSPPVSPVDFELDDLFDCLSMANILRLFAMVLLEKKILLVSSSYSVLLSVGEALKALMHPLAWSHVYVPVLPMALKGYLHCPTPFIFGVHTAYVRNSDVPRPSDDLVLVNLDRDCLTGGGDVVLPPARANVLRDKLAQLCKPRLLLRDHVDYLQEAQALRTGKTKIFPSDAIRAVFQAEVTDILTGLEAYAFRFEFHGKSVSIVDTSNKSRQWASDSARFYSALLQTQAFSAHISGLSS